MPQEMDVAQSAQTVWSLADKMAAIQCVFAGLMLFVTVVSVVYAFKAYTHQKERAKKDAACQLARIYADDILFQYQIVTGVFDKADILSDIKTVFPMNRLETFTLDELYSFMARAGVNEVEFRSKMERIDPLVILDIMLITTKSIEERSMMREEYCAVDQSTGERIPKNAHILQIQFMDTVASLLNTLEWFSMNCRYGLADEELLYQSIHQTFLSTVWMLYYHISRKNNNNGDKYYTNTIWLFKEWRKRLQDQNERIESERKAAMETMRTAHERYENAGSEYAGKALK